MSLPQGRSHRPAVQHQRASVETGQWWHQPADARTVLAQMFQMQSEVSVQGDLAYLLQGPAHPCLRPCTMQTQHVCPVCLSAQAQRDVFRICQTSTYATGCQPCACVIKMGFDRLRRSRPQSACPQSARHCRECFSNSTMPQQESSHSNVYLTVSHCKRNHPHLRVEQQMPRLPKRR